MHDFDEIEALARAGQKIAAIKLFRERTSLGLKDAKDAVEHFQAHGSWLPQHAVASGAMAEPPPPPAADGTSPRLEIVEAFVAKARLIDAIKELRALTGRGLHECKDAVEAYRERGHWPSELLAWFETPSATGVASAPTPPTAAVPMPAASRGADPAVLQAVADHLGHAPDIQLVAPARRSTTDGHLVMLRDRACFVHDRSRLVDPEIPYDGVTHVKITPGPRATLHIGVHGFDDQLSMSAADAEAALALLRVFGR